MQRKRNKLFILLIVILLIVSGCSKTDAVKFKKEYEKYNKSVSELKIDKDNPFVYVDDLDKIIKEEKAFVLFYGNPQDSTSREMVKSIIDVAKTNNLKKVYYIQMEEDKKYEILDTSISRMPSLLAVIKKEVHAIAIESHKVNFIIEPVVTELSTCDIEVGC